MSWIGKAFKAVFGSSDSGQSIAEAAVNTYERYNPSKVKEHEMSIEDQKAGDESQAAAYNLQMPSHDSWFDSFIDGWNRSIRPAFSTWALGELCGWWDVNTWDTMNPFEQNLIWTIVGFWFGSRVIFKDIPKAFIAYKQWRAANVNS